MTDPPALLVRALARLYVPPMSKSTQLRRDPLLFMTLAGVAACIATGCQLPAPRFAEAVERRTAPDFTLEDLQGQSVKLSEFRGRPVVLAFFAYG